MKDAILNIKVLTYMAIALILLMIIGETAYSWSQNHTYKFDFLLYGVLGSIFGIFLIRSFTHKKKDYKLFSLGRLWISNKHLNRVIAYSFLGVLIFGVNSEISIVKMLHLAFTGFAIAMAYVNLIWYYKKYSLEWYGSIVGGFVGVGGFLIGFLTDILTIAQGEAIAASPIVLWILSTTKKQ